LSKKDAEKSENLMAKFLENNETYIKTSITQMAKYFETNGVFDAINDAGTTDKIKATKNILNIFQDGLTDEWRETMYERIAGTTQLTKVGAGAGVMLIAQVIPLLYPRISVKLTHRRNNYINVEAQKKLDATLIGEGGINENIDVFTPQPPSIEAYADYIKAIYNMPGNVKDSDGNEVLDDQGNPTPILETGKNDDGFLYITYNGTAVNRITDIIDVRAKVRDEVLDNIQISDDQKTLIL
jgi:hypothetical protein